MVSQFKELIAGRPYHTDVRGRAGVGGGGLGGFVCGGKRGERGRNRGAFIEGAKK